VCPLVGLHKGVFVIKKSTAILILVCVVSLLLVSVTVAQEEADVSDYVPGTDITEQIRNDLNAGLGVTLPAGHYYVSESIFVFGYSGTIKGAGKGKTVIEAAQDFDPLVHPIVSDQFKITQMFALFWSTGDVTFKDMTLLITEDAPALPHVNPWVGYSTTIDNAIAVNAVGQDVENGLTITIKNVEVIGENSDESGSHNGKNLLYPLIVTNWFGSGPINAVIKNCEIKNAGAPAIEYFSAYEGSGEIKDNKIIDSDVGIWLGWGLESADVTVKDNQFTNITVDPIQNYFPISSYCIKNNTLDGSPMANDCPK
jgi:hypothetical protein